MYKSPQRLGEVHVGCPSPKLPHCLPLSIPLHHPQFPTLLLTVPKPPTLAEFPQLTRDQADWEK